MTHLATITTSSTRTAAPPPGHMQAIGPRSAARAQQRPASHKPYRGPGDSPAIVDPTVVTRLRAHRIAQEIARQPQLVADLYASCDRAPLGWENAR
jgi:hypothetical protein